MVVLGYCCRTWSFLWHKSTSVNQYTLSLPCRVFSADSCVAMGDSWTTIGMISALVSINLQKVDKPHSSHGYKKAFWCRKRPWSIHRTHTWDGCERRAGRLQVRCWVLQFICFTRRCWAWFSMQVEELYSLDASSMADMEWVSPSCFLRQSIEYIIFWMK